MHHEALHNWIRQDEANRGERTDRPNPGQTEELRRLRKENAELRRATHATEVPPARHPQRNPEGGERFFRLNEPDKEEV